MRFLFTILSYAALAWIAAFVWFFVQIPTAPLPESRKADAIIVLTGGQERIARGLSMLAEGAAPVLFISGVDERLSVARLLSTGASEETQQKIRDIGGEVVLDHYSRSTVSNADQSAAFIKKRGIKSIRLVTANYHMKRALHEFREANPGLSILPDPVFPPGFQRELWWRDDNSRRLIFSEFYKYVAIVMRDAARPAERAHE